MNNVTSYWKSSVSDVGSIVSKIKRGKVVKSTLSAGGREVSLLLYGEKNNLYRTANLSSALGASDRKCYADKTHSDYRPTLLLVGCIHGGEFEGTMALLNLISILETGNDLKGEPNEFLYKAQERINFLIIPCMNPDGRARIDFDSMVGKSFEELRFYNQGTWKDGSLCNWPDCKKIHPIKEYCDFMGAYFNDDGINFMHDDFFGKKAAETQLLFDTVDEFVPDLTVLLHGGTNCVSGILKPSYTPEWIKEKLMNLEKMVKRRNDELEIPYNITSLNRGENDPTPASFNLISALYHVCGEPCITYESNQGLTGCKLRGYTPEEIYKSHMVLFEESVKFTEGKEEKKYED